MDVKIIKAKGPNGFYTLQLDKSKTVNQNNPYAINQNNQSE